MSNATANRQLMTVGDAGRAMHLPVAASTHLYEATMVSQLDDGTGLCPTSTASSGPCIGVIDAEYNNSSGSAGALRGKILTDRIVLMVNGTSTDACSEATLIGSTLFALDDHTVADNDNSGTLKPAGMFMGLEADGFVRVYVSSSRVHSPAADPGALTFAAVAGTANQTLQAIPDPTDTPASADALRDDLVAVHWPVLRNNFADLATQLNAIRTALVAAGLMA